MTYNRIREQVRPILRKRLIRPTFGNILAIAIPFNGALACGNGDVLHALFDVGIGFHSHRLVRLPSRRILSDQVAVSEGGDLDGRHCTEPAVTRHLSEGSRGWLRSGPHARSPNAQLPWPSRYQVGVWVLQLVSRFLDEARWKYRAVANP